MIPNSSLIILAAGNSSRLGSPKQLLKYKASTLLQSTIQAACDSKVENVVLVLGAYDNVILSQTDLLRADLIYNPEWKLGMGRTLKLALNNINKLIENQIVIIITSDQPFVTSKIIDELISAYQQSNKKIVACAYAGTFGVPVLIDKYYFEKLMELDDHEGAKKLLLKFKEDVITIPFDLGEVDIDTKEDYLRLLKE